jgi:hypothetical protein
MTSLQEKTIVESLEEIARQLKLISAHLLAIARKKP